MNELDKFIKEMNLVFTNTLTRDDFCVVDFDLDKQEINYNNSISLYELLNKFNTVIFSSVLTSIFLYMIFT